jgi:hypothetical protein
MTRYKDVTNPTLFKVYSYDGIDRFQPRLGMVLSDANHPVAPLIDHPICKAISTRSSYRYRLTAFRLVIHALVGVIAKIHRSIVDRECTSSIFMHSVTGIE